MATLIVKVTRDQHRWIKRLAKSEHRTVSDLVRHRLLSEPPPLDEDTVRGETASEQPHVSRRV